MKFGKWILNNFWLKIVSLILAFGTWFYIANLIENSTEKRILARILPTYSRMISKKLNVEAVFVGELPKGYKLALDEVSIEPPYLVVAGPRFIFNNVNKLETAPIDISEYRKSFIYEAQIASISKSVDTEKLLVNVTIPIRKVNSAKDVSAKDKP
ncbi:MAG: YbbR-like domain-containing protein [Candidatus Omnitrophica bacterium]|nr:YbbR-like domain-containing protein [Candidatus Omnitrophota bacterium]